MKFHKKAGRFLTALLLVVLCTLTGIFSGCDVVYTALMELETESFTEELGSDSWDYEDEDSWDEELETEDLQSQDSQSQNQQEEETSQAADSEGAQKADVSEDGTYTSVEDVALYIHLYGHLPSNYITKKEAQEAGWESSKGNLWDVADGMSIGGSRFGNYEGALPDASGRKWYECDVNYEGGYRGSERILYSNDGLIYYTGDHYKTFEQLH